jgi:hypothetical protein
MRTVSIIAARTRITLTAYTDKSITAGHVSVRLKSSAA